MLKFIFFSWTFSRGRTPCLRNKKKKKRLRNWSIRAWASVPMWAAVAALPAAGTSPCCHSETVGCSQGSASPLQLPLRGMRGCLCVPSVKCRGRFLLPRRSLSAFEQEVNEYSCAICVLPQTWATGCPGPASEPCGLGVAFLCLQIHSDVPIHVHLFLDWACSDLSVTFARL